MAIIVNNKLAEKNTVWKLWTFMCGKSCGLSYVETLVWKLSVFEGKQVTANEWFPRQYDHLSAHLLLLIHHLKM